MSSTFYLWPKCSLIWTHIICMTVFFFFFKLCDSILKGTIFFGLHFCSEPIHSYQWRVRMLHAEVPDVLIYFPRGSTSTLMLMMECNDAAIGFFFVQQQH